jgi:hypothetical protein
MARRTPPKPEDRRLLERIRGQHWTVDELRRVLTHLDLRAPTLVVQEVHAKLMGELDQRRPFREVSDEPEQSQDHEEDDEQQ